VRAFGVKYVAMWKNETVVALKVGKSAWANVYGGVLYEYGGYGEVTGEVIATGDGTTGPFTGFLANPPIVPGSLSITDGVETITDNGDGTLSGPVGNTINYDTGAYSVTFTAATEIGAVITADYMPAEAVFTSPAGGETVFNLDHFPVVEGSETIYKNDILIAKPAEYTIDYDTGIITTPALIAGDVITAHYDWIDGETFDPSGYKFDDIVGLQYDSRIGLYYNGAYSSGAGETAAVLAIENSNGDESLDSFEKGYLIVTLASEDAANVRAAITIEIRLEKTAPLSIEFNIPEAMPKDTWVMT